MREQLIQYVNLLFAGAPDSDDIKQEILQNTLDRYDDLVSQGKAPEAAYRLAISGIGDINEILNHEPEQTIHQIPSPAAESENEETDSDSRKKNRAIAIGFYIISPIPLILLSEFGYETIGLCFTLILIAFATMELIQNREPSTQETAAPVDTDFCHPLKKNIGNLIWAIGIALYFAISFMSGAWFITWIIFPILGCIKGLINAIIDLKEAANHET